MLSAVLSDEPEACELVRQEYQLNGQLPESHLTDNIIQTSLDQAEELVDELRKLDYEELQNYPVSLVIAGVTIADQIALLGDPADDNSAIKTILNRPTKFKPKDRLNLWLSKSHLRH